MVVDHKIYLNGFSGSLSKSRKRVGRGIGSGRGGTSGSGDKGQSARSGVSMKRRHAEFARRFPKVGFRSRTQKMSILTLRDLIRLIENRGLDTSKMISVSDLRDYGVNTEHGLKIIGKAEVPKIQVTANAFSKGASDSIRASLGIAEVKN